MPVLALYASFATAENPNAWPFSFDPQIAEDPATIEARLLVLGDGLPGLPEDEMVDVELDEVTLSFYTEVHVALQRAVASDPDHTAAIDRTPVACARHAMVAELLPPTTTGGPECDGIAAQLAAARYAADRNCQLIEFPETYVWDHPPAQFDPDTVSNYEGLIALAGEALSHVDLPLGLLPDSFFTDLRAIISKVRYPTLTDLALKRFFAYIVTWLRLNTADACYAPDVLGEWKAHMVDLAAELSQLMTELKALHKAGLAHARADRQAVLDAGRIRAKLPYPSLSDAEREQLAYWVGGIYWRMRGAGLVTIPEDGWQTRRVFFLLAPFLEIGRAAGADQGGLPAFLIFLRIFARWSEWFDMGTTTGPGALDKYNDLVEMTNRGRFQVEAAVDQLTALGYDARSLMAGGLQMGPCYYFAWDQLLDFRLGEDLTFPYMHFLEAPTSVGEVCTGASIALGFTRTLLAGRSALPTLPPRTSYKPPP